MTVKALLVLASATLALGQRPFFAGTKPIGFPIVTTTTEVLADRFGEGETTTQKLPLEANGDRDLVDRLSKLPIDKQPFWFINWQALEAHRQKPQTYPQRPNLFVDSTNGEFISNFDSNSPNSSSLTPNSSSLIPNSSSLIPNSGKVNITPANPNANLGNVNPILVSPISNSSPTNVNVLADDFTSNRFGDDELPKITEHNLGNAFTNSNSQGDYSKSAGVLLSLGDKKKASLKNTKNVTTF